MTDIIVGLIFAVIVLGSIVFIAKRFLKPVKGPLPDCCGINGNKEMNLKRKV